MADTVAVPGGSASAASAGATLAGATSAATAGATSAGATSAARAGASSTAAFWSGDEEDWGGTLTEQEIAELTALVGAGGPAAEDEPWDPGSEAGVDGAAAVPSWLAEWPAELRDPDLDPPPGPPGPEALPGLMPRGLGTAGGFGAGGATDQLPPGPVLAGLAGDKWAAGLGRASDDELAGLMIAWRRLASWAAAGELAAVAELARRREAQVAAGADPHLAEHVADEVAMTLTLTAWSAGALVDRAVGLAGLPRTMAALAAGDIDVPKALVIVAETTGLTRPHAAQVEAAVLGRAPGQTTGELRRAVRRAVIAADPCAAGRRKDTALARARVERWAEDAGTAALAGRDLPAAGALAADAHLSAWARRLKAAGLDGTLDQLRAKVYLALLNGQPVQSLLPAAEPVPAGPSKPPPPATGGANPGIPGTVDPRLPATANPGIPGTAGAGSPRPTDLGISGTVNPGISGTVNPGISGTVNLTLPLATWLSWSGAPGEVAGYGPVDAADSRELAAVLARNPATRWCLTVTDTGGQAVAHGCARAGPAGGALSEPPGGGPGPPGPDPRQQDPRAPYPRAPDSNSLGPVPPTAVSEWLGAVSLSWVGPGACDHRYESPAYRPPPSLAHLVQVRQQACTAPGCRRPAARCDAEHTIAYHRGGRTCLCNLGPCCRRHHRAKQTAGWRLEQPSPGVFRWTTPLGRGRTTGPTEYPVG